MSLNSLKNQKQFDLVNLRGKKLSTRYFIVVVSQDFDLINVGSVNPTFFGIKVSKKISKSACVRNKIKRRIRHLMRIMLNDADLNLTKMAVIFIPYKGFDSVEFSILSSEFKSLLKKQQDKL